MFHKLEDIGGGDKFSVASTMSGVALIVDANAAEAAQNAGIVTDLGFRVAIAGTFDEANRQLARMSDLVMLMADVRLGEYNGLHLALRVRRVRPRTHIIITDSTRDAVLHRETQRLNLTYLVKPISVETLLEITTKLTQGIQQQRVDRRWPRNYA